MAVAVAVARWRHLVGVASWGFSRAVSPQTRLSGLALPTRSPISCSSVPPVADAQGDSYTSSLATPELRRNGRLAADRRDSGKMAQCRKATFPPNLAKVFLSGLESLLEDSFTH